jgi:hypothetical protein
MSVGNLQSDEGVRRRLMATLVDDGGANSGVSESACRTTKT